MAVWLLDDEERRGRLIQEGRALQSAFYTNYAMNSPKDLTAAARRYDTRLAIPSGPARVESRQALDDVRQQLSALGGA